MEQALETKQAAVFTKSLKHELLPATATVFHPRTGDIIRVRAGFRMMTDGELVANQAAEAERLAAKRPITNAEILDTLAPLFGTRSGRIELAGLGDFDELTAAAATPEAKFRWYFGPDGGESPEELEFETKVLRALFASYSQLFFRLIPLELVDLVAGLPLPDGGDAQVSEAPADGARA